jgi:hypothetical protein
MSRAIALGVLLAWTVPALAYPVDLEFERNGLDVMAMVDQVGAQTIVRVTNGEAFPVRCEAIFRNGPEQSRARRAVLQPGDTRPFAFAPNRTVVRMRVQVWCESAEAVGPGD